MHSGNRKANNRGGSNLASATDSSTDVVVEGLPLVNGFSGLFNTSNGGVSFQKLLANNYVSAEFAQHLESRIVVRVSHKF